MRVTLYILNCNYEQYLSEAIESALAQDYQDIELVIIDDGSKDNSQNVINHYSKKFTQVTVILNNENKGLIKSANIALGVASGDFIMRLDADDVLLPNAVSTLVSYYNQTEEKTEKIVGVFGNYVEIDADGNFVKDVLKQSQPIGNSDFLVPIHGACTLINKKWLQSIGGYDEEFSRQDGFYLWAKAAALGCKILGCGGRIFKYRRHSISLSSAWGKILDQRRAIANKIVSQHFASVKYDILLPLKDSVLQDTSAAFSSIVRGLRDKIRTLSNDCEIFVVCSNPLAAQIIQDEMDEYKVHSIYRDAELEESEISLKRSLGQVVFGEQDQDAQNFVLIMTMASLVVPTDSIKLLINQATIFSGFDALILGRIIHGELYETKDGLLNESPELNSKLIEEKTIIERVPGVLVVRTHLWQDFLSDKQLSVGLAEC